jgi:hypothetical protein
MGSMRDISLWGNAHPGPFPRQREKWVPGPGNIEALDWHWFRRSTLEFWLTPTRRFEIARFHLTKGLIRGKKDGSLTVKAKVFDAILTSVPHH